VQQRGDIRSGEVLARAQAQHQRAARSSDHDLIGRVHGDDGDRVGPSQQPHCLEHRFFEICPIVALLDEMSDHFGVGLRAEDVSPALELLLEGQIVLDNPIMDDRDLSVAVAVGVSVRVRWGAVGGPAGVAQPNRSRRDPLTEVLS
jgi:hypothetical protein